MAAVSGVGRVNRSDLWLRRRISTRLERDRALWFVHGQPGTLIFVDVTAGFVTLSGYVASSALRRRAEAVARLLGALGVDNRLRISFLDEYANG